MREGPFMRMLLVELSKHPAIRVWRQQVGTVAIEGTNLDGGSLRYFHAGPPKGASDISGIIRGGRRIEIEVKGPKGRRSPEQVRWAEFIESFGGIYVLATYDVTASDRENCARIARQVLGHLPS